MERGGGGEGVRDRGGGVETHLLAPLSTADGVVCFVELSNKIILLGAHNTSLGEYKCQK